MGERPRFVFAYANDRVDDRGDLRNLIEELYAVEAALRDPEKVGQCEVVSLPNVDLERFFDACQHDQRRLSLVHYGGHADGKTLLFEDRKRGVNATSARSIAEFLATLRALKLVVLNGCSTDGQVAALLDRGVPAVVATSTEIKDDVATQFAKRFYLALAASATIADAFTQASSAVKASLGIHADDADAIRSVLRDVARSSRKVDTAPAWPWTLHGKPEALALSLVPAPSVAASGPHAGMPAASVVPATGAPPDRAPAASAVPAAGVVPVSSSVPVTGAPPDRAPVASVVPGPSAPPHVRASPAVPARTLRLWGIMLVIASAAAASVAYVAYAVQSPSRRSGPPAAALGIDTGLGADTPRLDIRSTGDAAVRDDAQDSPAAVARRAVASPAGSGKQAPSHCVAIGDEARSWSKKAAEMAARRSDQELDFFIAAFEALPDVLKTRDRRGEIERLKNQLEEGEPRNAIRGIRNLWNQILRDPKTCPP